MAGNKRQIPTELEGIAKIEDVDAIQEQVDRCYSQDKYEEFQNAVEKIIDRFLKGKVGWAIVVWIISIVGSMLAQKFLQIF